MEITIKTKKDIEIMRQGGKILAEILRELSEKTRAGMSTYEIDQLAGVLLKNHNVGSAFLGYNNYPAVTCIGINNTAVHGIPSKNDIILEGDIVTIDIGAVYKGLYVDHATTKGIGEISKRRRSLVDTTKKALKEAVKKAVAGKRVGDISNAIQTTAEKEGFSVVTQMTGHGVGYSIHEAPEIPCFGKKGTGPMLEEGMTLAIEPMLVDGDPGLKILEDGWTTKTENGGDFAIFEHTIVVGRKHAEILTK